MADDKRYIRWESVDQMPGILARLWKECDALKAYCESRGIKYDGYKALPPDRPKQEENS